LYDPTATGRMITVWVFSPSVVAGASYVFFSFVV
jgi:hypothetical protein